MLPFRPMRLFVPLFAALLAASVPAFAQTVERHTATTTDGVDLVLKRLAAPGAVPVLLLHGLGSSAAEWDLPSKSFARALYQAGYDVWMSNHRRTGRTPADRS